MITSGLPTSALDIDAAGVQTLLGECHPGVRVDGVELLGTTELTNSHARLRVAYAEPAGAPEVMFCKLLPDDPARRRSIADSGMGRREALFYATMAPHVTLRVPAVHGVGYDDGDGSFALLLEDLPSTGCPVSDGTWGIVPDAAAGALDDLARMHVRYEQPARRQAEAAWVTPSSRGSSYGTSLLRYGLEHHRDRLSADFATIAELYIDHTDLLYELWHRGPATVIHGDPHIGNLFVDGDRTGFLDWGLINLGSALRDVSYFITMALDIEDRRRHEAELIRHYLEARAGAGGTPVSFDDAWLAHRLQAAYTVPACCQIVTFPDGVTERRRIFAEAFLARAEAAIADLEARAALRRVAGL